MFSEPQVKGVAFETILRELRRLRGDAVADRVIELLTTDGDGVIGTSAFVSSAWYPIGEYRRLLSAVRAATGEDIQIIRDLGRAAVLSDVPRLYRGMLRLLSPSTIAEQGARYFKRFYDTGSFTVVGDDERRIEARFVGCHGFDRNMWVDVSGSIEAFIELAGVRDVTVRITEGGRDDEPTATIVARWA